MYLECVQLGQVTTKFSISNFIIISSADILYAPVITIRNGKINWLCIGLTQAAVCTVVAFLKQQEII